MRRHVLSVSIAIALLGVATARTQVAQTPAPGVSPFAGRWEITIRPPANQPSPIGEFPFCILEITAAGPAVSGKVLATAGAPMLVVTLTDASVKGDQLTAALEMSGKHIRFTGRRVGDHLEGKAVADGETDEATWVGRITTKDKIDLSQLMQTMTATLQSGSGAAPSTTGAAPSAKAVDQPADTKAYAAALGKSGPERVTALQQFLKDFPDSKSKEQASLQIALAPPNLADKAVALRKFMTEFPTSRLKEQAEYQLTTTFTNAAERQSAQEQFIKDHSKSAYAGTIYASWFSTQVLEKPVNEARLAATIDGYLESSPDMSLPAGNYTRSMRASTMNTVADKLMSNDVMLDKALEVIQKAVALAGEKEEPTSRGMYTTTLGQVLFKLQRYDEAGETLKRAIQIAGGDGDAEAQLFLGKFYDVKHDDEAALNAYMKASELGAPYDTKALLEKAYIRKYGSLAGLDARMDAIYRAKPKGFDPGHYGRTKATKDPARVVLAELFTGAECAPCVASDLAFDGLTERYAHDTLAVLVYHLHIPGPDPMTNTDTEARAKYYKVTATPTAVVDGLAPKSGGGGAAQAPGVFADYKGKVEARVDKAPLATLKDFRARVDDKSLKVTGQATLLSGAAEKAGKVTLHVAVVEDEIRYLGSNGVRFHSLVVRKLLGSPEGTVLQKAGAKTAFSASIELAAVHASLDAYLDKYEKDRQARQNGFAFKDRVDRLDPKKLRVVAFVQDDETKEILQAVFVTAGK
jgi:tetratricopeptide (TPR) repeat protein